MRHLDLFSGIGGFALAAEWAWGDRHEIVGFCEIDKFCQKVLHKHWPNKTIFDDIKELTGDKIGSVDIVTGGFPCQPFSLAGVSKKNSLGRPHGFLDETQGTLFHDILGSSSTVHMEVSYGLFPHSSYSVSMSMN